MRLAVLVSGRGSNLQAILDAGLPVTVVVSNVADAPALDRARAAGVETLVMPKGTREERDRWLVAELRERSIELVALAGYNRIVSDCVLEAFADRIVNVHPSLLPAFGGGMAPEPQRQALEHGVKLAGCTVHLVTAAVDEGPILAQACVPVLNDDTVETLSDRILEQEHRLLPQVLRWFMEGQVRVEGRRTIVPSSCSAWLPSC